MYTHIYCPTCNTYFDKGYTFCRHITVRCKHVVQGIPVVAKTTSKSLTRFKPLTDDSKYTEITSSDSLYKKLHASFRHSTNTDFNGARYFVAYTDKIKDTNVEVERVDYNPVRMFDPKGIKEVTIFLVLSNKNELIQADNILNLYSEFYITIQGVNVYAARWIKPNSRALYDYSVESGYIGQLGRTFYHGKSEEEVVKGCIKKREKERKGVNNYD